MSDFIRQLSDFSARTKRMLNTYPYECRMNERSVIEFSDKFCPFAAPSGSNSSLMGVSIEQSSLVPDHEAWWFYRDETIPGGFRIEKMKWGDV